MYISAYDIYDTYSYIYDIYTHFYSYMTCNINHCNGCVYDIYIDTYYNYYYPLFPAGCSYLSMQGRGVAIDRNLEGSDVSQREDPNSF